MFTGSFDGSGHTITNFTYSTDTDYIGLFGSVGNDEIKNINITNVNVNGDKYIGGLVGGNSGSISNCYVTGSVSGNRYIGGLVGCNTMIWMTSGNISDCHTDGNVTGNSFVGGLVGGNMVGNISNCCADGNVTSNGDNSNYVGGLVGCNYGSISNSYVTGSVSGGDGSGYLGGLAGYSMNMSGNGIYNCYTTGSVSGGDGSHRLGGLVGENCGSISNSYATGSVSGGNYSQFLGGLAGLSMDMMMGGDGISNCYATGSVSGGDGSYSLGGLVGSNMMGDEVSASFWDVQTSGLSTSAGGIGLSTEQMKTKSIYIGAGWDFTREIANGAEDIWLIVDGLNYPCLASQYHYGGGEGTEQQPYLIYTPVELSLVGDKPDNHFRLMADIDWNEYGRKDIMIGEYPNYPFTGVFDGNGYTIYNFAHEVAAQDFVGFFGYVTGDDAEIKNLRLVDIDIYAATGDYVGALVGYNNGGSITNVYVTGSVTGWCGVGGLAGVNYDGFVRRCHANCTVDGYEDAGGLVGINYNHVTNCRSAGSVIGMRFIGGLVGYNWDGDITNSFSTGPVTAFDFFGGLVGYNRDGTVADSFWDVQTSGQSTSYGGTGLETAEMQTQNTFTDTGWDFMGESVNGTDDIWRMCIDGIDYPKLSWQFLPGDFVCSDGVDLADFAVLADTWSLSSGQTGYNDLCDLIDDNTIDLNDLAVFAENWLRK